MTLNCRIKLRTSTFRFNQQSYPNVIFRTRDLLFEVSHCCVTQAHIWNQYRQWPKKIPSLIFCCWDFCHFWRPDLFIYIFCEHLKALENTVTEKKKIQWKTARKTSPVSCCRKHLTLTVSRWVTWFSMACPRRIQTDILADFRVLTGT